MEKSYELDELKELYIKSLEDLLKNKESPWIDPEVLASTTGTTTTQISNVIINYDDFVENTKGKISTRKQYKKKTSFLKKLKDSSTGIIE